MDKTAQGGAFGVTGALGSLFDYQDAQAFDNSVQQLSTELRTVFRIQGEGTLSDKEQEQYNLQLPSRKFDKKGNEAILTQLNARINARINTPIGNSQGVDPDAIADRYLNQ
jgi:hypothetical protein